MFFPRAIYDDDVENADLWVVALAEDPVPGSLVGPTTHCLLKKQFQRLRDGDRFWYENPTTFTAEQLAEIRKTSLSRVMCENLNGENSNGIVSIQKDAFLAATDGVRRVECAGITKFNLRMWKEIAARPPKPTGTSRVLNCAPHSNDISFLLLSICQGFFVLGPLGRVEPNWI